MCPSDAARGPIAAIEDGDMIELDFAKRCINLCVSDEVLARRLDKIPLDLHLPERGYERLFRQHVLQADQGLAFDFLRGKTEGGIVPKRSF